MYNSQRYRRDYYEKEPVTALFFILLAYHRGIIVKCCVFLQKSLVPKGYKTFLCATNTS